MRGAPSVSGSCLSERYAWWWTDERAFLPSDGERTPAVEPWSRDRQEALLTASLTACGPGLNDDDERCTRVHGKPRAEGQILATSGDVARLAGVSRATVS